MRYTLLFSLAPGLLEALEQVIRGELLTFRRHHHSLLHGLLLVEILDLAKSDTLHATCGCTSGVTEDECVVLRITAWFWRQIQNLCRLPVFHDLIVLHGEITGHQVELPALIALIFCVT